MKGLLTGVSEKYRQMLLKRYDTQIEGLRNEINKSDDITIKNQLATSMANLIEQQSVLKSKKYCGSNIIIIPSLSDPMDFTSPSRMRILLISIFLGLTTGIFITMLYEKVIKGA